MHKQGTTMCLSLNVLQKSTHDMSAGVVALRFSARRDGSHSPEKSLFFLSHFLQLLIEVRLACIANSFLNKIPPPPTSLW